MYSATGGRETLSRPPTRHENPVTHLPLPPHSPDLNPIEQSFAKIKHWMRMAQKRTVDDTWRYVGSLVATIEPTECRNDFANAGYASVKN